MTASSPPLGSATAWPPPAATDWNYLLLELKQLDGDPDVYGMLYNASDDGRYPTGNTRGWDFREVSSSARGSARLTVGKRDWAHPNAEGVYLCVTAYGDRVASYELRSMFTRCPAAFAVDGIGSHRRDAVLGAGAVDVDDDQRSRRVRRGVGDVRVQNLRGPRVHAAGGRARRRAPGARLRPCAASG